MPTSQSAQHASVPRPTARELVEFIRVFASTLLAAGSQTSRMDRTATRIAQAYGYKLDLAIFSRHFMFSAFTVSESGIVQERYTAVGSIMAGGFDFHRVTLLNALSWAIEDEKLSLAEAWRRFHAICAQPGISPARLRFLVTSANTAMCGVFNGDWVAMCIVFVSVYLCYFMEQRLLAVGMDVKITFFLCAFTSSLLASCSFLLGLGETPETAVASSILFLIPGYPLINATLDFWDGHILMGVSRLIHALTLVVCITLGLALSMSLMGVDKL